VGMRMVETPDTLCKTAEAAQTLAERSFGDGAVFLERFVRHARHIEVQVFGMGDGRAAHCFERECSIQRRFQKLVEETPAPGLGAATRARMHAAAEKLARTIRYRSAGTVEFVYDSERDEFYFLEMNTRIQVEHPVTEMATGLDLVALQLRLARGDDVGGDFADGRVVSSGHAIEVRVCAENPAKMFLPSPGRIEKLSFPERDGLRIDSGIRQGDTVTHHYDSMIAKMVVHAETREKAIDRMREALAATRIEGIVSNTKFLARVVDHPAFREGRINTRFIDSYRADLVG
jgi:3-methylcrotonyl-CoA carboxylase alpha subunit